MLKKLIAYLARHQLAAAWQDGYTHGYHAHGIHWHPTTATTTSTGGKATITYR